MPKPFFRLVALVVAPCLLADPAFAFLVSGSKPLLLARNAGRETRNVSFGSQALALGQTLARIPLDEPASVYAKDTLGSVALPPATAAKGGKDTGGVPTVAPDHRNWPTFTPRIQDRDGDNMPVWLTEAVLSIFHDVRNRLTIFRSGVEDLQKQIQKNRDAYAALETKASDLYGLSHNLQNSQNIEKSYALLTSYKRSIRKILTEFLKVSEGNMTEGASLEQAISIIEDFFNKQEPVELNLNEIAAGCATIVRRKPNFGQFQIIENYDAAISLVRASGLALDRSIVNLLINGAEAWDKNQPQKLIWMTTRWDRAENEVVLEIQDNGSGMNEETLRKIINPGYSSKTEFEGWRGFGLTPVIDALRDMKGTVTIASQEGSGTVFTLRFPLKTAAPADDYISNLGADLESARRDARAFWRLRLKGYGGFCIRVGKEPESHMVPMTEARIAVTALAQRVGFRKMKDEKGTVAAELASNLYWHGRRGSKGIIVWHEIQKDELRGIEIASLTRGRDIEDILKAVQTRWSSMGGGRGHGLPAALGYALRNEHDRFIVDSGGKKVTFQLRHLPEIGPGSVQNGALFVVQCYLEPTAKPEDARVRRAS